jgi:hypothetical protein
MHHLQMQATVEGTKPKLGVCFFEEKERLKDLEGFLCVKLQLIDDFNEKLRPTNLA